MKSEKFLIIYSFLACLFLMLMGIFSARSSGQLMSSFIYLPLVFFFGTKIFYQLSLSSSKSTASKKILPLTVTTHSADHKGTDHTPAIAGVADQDKRLFLQLIGTTGISLLLMSLFSRKARDTFLGGGPAPDTVGLKNSAGETINPAEKLPTDGYVISDIDDETDINYYSFVHTSGAWYIMQYANGNFRYTKGDGNYSNNWDIRNKLRYDLFNNVFS